jgi:uncharacterized protein (DUF2062 family)
LSQESVTIVPPDEPASPPKIRVRPKGIQAWRRRLEYYYWRLVRLQGSPHELARGLSAGVFAGLFPLFGFQTLLGIAIAFVTRGSKIMAIAGTWISNPFTYVPIYAFNLQLGRWVLGTSSEHSISDFSSLQEIAAAGSELSSALFVGCAISGSAAAILSYGGGLRLVQWLRNRRYRKAMRNARKRQQMEQSVFPSSEPHSR